MNYSGYICKVTFSNKNVGGVVESHGTSVYNYRNHEVHNWFVVFVKWNSVEEFKQNNREIDSVVGDRDIIDSYRSDDYKKSIPFLRIRHAKYILDTLLDEILSQF